MMKSELKYIGSILKVFVLFMFLGCHTELYHGLAESQANEMLLVLNQAGIQAGKTKDSSDSSTWIITVSPKDTAKALQLLIDKELPKISSQGFNDLFQKDSILPTNIQEKARYMSALCGELQNTLEQDDSVIKARVHITYAMRDRNDRRSEEIPRSAAVFLKTIPDYPMEHTISDQAVKKLIAAGVGGMAEDDVSVIRTVGKTGTLVSMKLFDELNEQSNDSRIIVWVLYAVLCLTGILITILAGRKVFEAKAISEEKD